MNASQYSIMQTLNDTITRFDISPAHTLKQQEVVHKERAQTLYETCWFVEKDNEDKIVARYRSWTNQAMQAPFRLQIGWERYSPSGTLLDREVYYSKRDSTDYLH